MKNVLINGDPHPAVLLRLPKSGERCPVTGLSRSKLNTLILPSRANGFKPPVRSISLKQRGAVRGVRLIPAEGLLDYLLGLSSENSDQSLIKEVA